ncbi:MAG: methionyl-tRNA formyltransferase [Desulfovibrio sp.]|nr:methionyl-tRNA formyltransferase [Desulfovibrio sp.]
MAQAQNCRIVFMGTPDFAACILGALARWPVGQIVAVYTQPDRPAGRGHKLTPSPVKVLATELGLSVRQPPDFRNAEDVQALADLRPDVLVVAAYGLILPQAVLDTPRLAPLNVHASLLPRYRGAAPIQRAIMENWQPDAVSGVSIMHMVRELDAGPVYAMRSVALAGHTAGSLHDVLAALGGEAIISVLRGLLDGTAVCVEQSADGISYAAKMQKSDGMVDWSLPVAAVDAQIRGVTPWPGARARFHFTGMDEACELMLLPGSLGLEQPGYTVSPGEILLDAQGLAVACADGVYRLGEVKPQGRKFMRVQEFCNGYLRGVSQGLCGHALEFGR